MKKVSKRDMFALILLVAAGIGFLLYTYMYKPILADISTAKDTLSTRESSRDYYNLMVSSGEISKYEQEIEDKILAADETNATLLPDLKTTKIIHFFDEIALSCDITLTSVYFTDAELFDTTPDKTSVTEDTYLVGELADTIKGVSDNESEVPSAAGSDDPIAMQTFVEIKFEIDSYDTLMNFLKGVEDAGRSIYFDSLNVKKVYYNVEYDTGEFDDNGDSITETVREWNISVILKYSLVAIDKLSDADTGFDEVTPAQNPGAADPFVG